MAIKPSDFHKKYPVGHTPKKDFVDEGRPEGIRIGIIVRVDEINLKCDIKIITGGGTRYEVELTQGLCGPRSFWGGVPEIGSVVVVGYRRKHKQLAEAVILGYLPNGNRSALRFDPFSPVDLSELDPEDAAAIKREFGGTYRLKRPKFAPGDVGGMSSSGSEMLLSKDVWIVNRAGDNIKLNDSERTLSSETIHRVDIDGGVKRRYGPIRREALHTTSDVVDPKTNTLYSEKEGYYGREEYQAIGPGLNGSNSKFANSNGKLLDVINKNSYVTYSNGRRVFYPTTIPNRSPEPDDFDNGVGDVYTEVRTELRHQTNMAQDVVSEIDGFEIDPQTPYIEHVLGTVVGNDFSSTEGLRNYGKVLKPSLWSTGFEQTEGQFKLEEVDRSPLHEDIETKSLAAAYLLKILSPLGKEEIPFAVSVQKQGKILVNVPKPTVERYPDVKGISTEISMGGALKMYLGSASPTNTSLFLKTQGGIKADIGHNTDTNGAVDVTYHSIVNQKFQGVPENGGHTVKTEIIGNCLIATTGDSQETVDGSKFVLVNGRLSLQADRALINAHSGYTQNVGERNVLVAGKTQHNYALQVQETIVAGGHIKTILAGGSIETILAGAKTTNVLAGATVFNNPAGGFLVNVGAGLLGLTSGAAITATAGAAMTLTAGAAMTITAGALMAITAPVGCMITSLNIQLGGPTGVLGVVRALPILPHGVPSLDYITGLPYMGSATVRSN